MKKIAIRIGLLVLALVCLIGIFAISTMAEDAPTASIKGHNLALQDNVYIMYYVDFQNVPAGAEKGVLVWTNPQEEYTYGTQNAIASYDGVSSGYDVYYFTGVSAKMMSQDVYAKAYVKNGNEITYGKLDKYSVLQYAYNKKDNSALSQLLSKMLSYGAAAQTYFEYNTDRLANATYYQVKVTGGVLQDGTKSGLYPQNGEITLTATIENFNHWENAAGEVIGNEATLVGNVTKTETYTAFDQAPAHTHAWGNGVITTEPACTEEGVKTYTCSICGQTKTESIPALGHEYDANGICARCGQEQSSEGLVYTLNSDNQSYSVTGVENCTDTIVHIAKTYNGLPVTAIGEKAFADQTSITGVIIPNSVKTIGRRAFYNTGLTEITIPSSVTSIGTQIFYKADKLTTVFYNSTFSPTQDAVFLNTKSIKKVVFNGQYVPANICFGCGALTEVDILKNVRYICGYAFAECGNLSKVVFDIVELSMYRGDDRYQFKNCTSLTTINLPEGLTDLSHSTFQGCSNLCNITLPKTLSYINDRPFWGCYKITNVFISSIEAYCKIRYYSEEQSMSHAMSYGEHLYLNDKLITDLVIPDTVTRIPRYAFNSSDIKTVVIPDSVVSIGESAFKSSIKTVYYMGSENDWKVISGINQFNGATIIYNYTMK